MAVRKYRADALAAEVNQRAKKKPRPKPGENRP